MSNYEDPHPQKKVTAATTDAPQEEFISPVNVPTEIEDEAKKQARTDDKGTGDGAVSGSHPSRDAGNDR